MDLLKTIDRFNDVKHAIGDAFRQLAIGRGTPTVLVVIVDDAPTVQRTQPRDLDVEKALLVEALDVLGSHDGCRIVFEDVADAAEIGDLIERYAPLTGLHIMAHGDLDDGRDGPAAAHDALPTSRLMGQLSWKGHLRWVFLSGCYTPWLADALNEKLPLMVIGTEPATRDDTAARLARRFYSALSRGATLIQSYEAAVAEARVGLTSPREACVGTGGTQHGPTWPWHVDFEPRLRIEEWQLLGWPMPLSLRAFDGLRSTPRVIPRPLRQWVLFGGSGIPGFALSVAGATIAAVGWTSPVALGIAGALLVPGLALSVRRFRSGRRLIGLLRDGRAVRGRVRAEPDGAFTVAYPDAEGRLHTHTVRDDRTYPGRRLDVVLYDPERPEHALSTDAQWSLVGIAADGALGSPGLLFYMLASVPVIRWWVAVEMRGGRSGSPLSLRPGLARLLPARHGGHTDRALSQRAESRPMTDRIPVILLVFANDRMSEHAGYLRDLVDERRGVSKALEKGASHQAYRLVVEPNVTHEALFDLLDTHRQEIVGVHFGGHADPDGLHFEDADGRPMAADMDVVAQALATLPSLRWVFLNGCGTEAHADTLFEKVRVPIVVTDRAIRDDVATAFACRFYRRLGDGASLSEGFEHARAETQAEQGQVGRSLRQTRMVRRAGQANAKPSWPWVMRAPPDGPEALHWRLIAQAYGGAVDTTPTANAHRPAASVAPAKSPAGSTVSSPPRTLPVAVARSFAYGTWSRRGLEGWAGVVFSLAVSWGASTTDASNVPQILAGLGLLLVSCILVIVWQARRGRVVARTLRDGRVAFAKVTQVKASPFGGGARLRHTVELVFHDDEGAQRPGNARIRALGLVGSREQELVLYLPDRREVVLVDRLPGPVRFAPEGHVEPAGRLLLWSTPLVFGLTVLTLVGLLITVI